jgi:cbb3-type cytochrome oxidase subunit 3
MKSIADVVSASGLAFYAEVALAIFFLVFIAIGLRLLGHRDQWEHAAHLPLEDDTSPSHATIRHSPPALP